MYLAANEHCAAEEKNGNFVPKPARVVECPGCAAAVIIFPNIINHCEYCDRPVE